MKLLAGGIALLILVLSFCIVNYIYVVDCLETIIDDLDSIERDIKVLEWDAAHAKSVNVIQKWAEKENYYMAVLWHQHIDDVAVALNQIKSDIELRDLQEAENSIIEARTIVMDIIEMESISLGNVF